MAALTASQTPCRRICSVDRSHSKAASLGDADSFAFVPGYTSGRTSGAGRPPPCQDAQSDSKSISPCGRN